MGGFDWAGLPLVAALFGISDIEALVNDLNTIKLHRKPDTGSGERE